ncbi:MAG TPA: tetratricopeptide repeat protein [Burkholderiales bacterium]|nr:tetratricopeptide repeat protein [Burkholderiales bacterium]
MMRDFAGYALSGATADGVQAFEQAKHQLRCYIGDPVASVDQAIAKSPAMTMAHALKAWLHLLGTEPAGLAVARQSLEQASRLSSNDRERGHLEAIGLVIDGHWRAAGRVLEDVGAAYPGDAFTLQVGHQIDFFTGDSRMLRDRVARALPAWSESIPGYHAVLGMYAFGLEECADYAAAERFGRESVEREPRDGWGWHAVAHVMEMQARSEEGIAWLQPNAEAWSRESFFAVHNWWHVALFHLEHGNIDEVLRIFDGPVHGARSTIVLEMIDASAMLWRLHLRGFDVERRWQTVADGWAPLASAGNYAFNDFHAMMAFVGAGRRAEQAAVIESLEAAAGGENDTAAFAREAGLPAARAIRAFGEGRYEECVQGLRAVRYFAHRFGGSHAQRDLLDLTIFEAALRAGMQPLASGLAAERLARRPQSPLARLFVQRAAMHQDEQDRKAA